MIFNIVLGKHKRFFIKKNKETISTISDLAILHLLTCSHKRMLIIMEDKEKLEVVFETIKESLKESGFWKIIDKYRVSPYNELICETGSRIRGFFLNTGSSACGMKGQDADIILSDGFLSKNEIEIKGILLPILYTTEGTRLVIFSDDPIEKTFMKDSINFKEIGF